MNIRSIACLLLFPLFLIIFNFSSANAAQIKKNGFIINFEVIRNVGYTDTLITSYGSYPAPHASPNMYARQVKISVVLTGKITNDLFRDFRTVILYFTSSDNEGNSKERVITINDLGPHENQLFDLPLGQRIGDSDYDANATLVKFQYIYKDGTTEEVKL